MRSEWIVAVTGVEGTLRLSLVLRPAGRRCERSLPEKGVFRISPAELATLNDSSVFGKS